VRDATLGRQHRVAGGEHQAEQVVAGVTVERGLERRQRVGLVAGDVAELLVAALGDARAPQPVDRAVLGGRHQPGPGVGGHAGFRPALERGDQRVLGELLGESDVTHHAREPGDHPRRLDPPHGVDRTMGVLGGHRGRVDHFEVVAQAAAPAVAPNPPPTRESWYG